MKAWPAELVRVALIQAGTGEPAFGKSLREVESAFVARPYGDNARIARSAQALAAWADDLAGRLNTRKIDRALAQQLLTRIPTVAGDVPDHDTARQLGWAYRAIWEELHPDEKGKTPAALAELEKYLGLTLPVGRMKEKDTDGVIVRDLAESLRRVYEYEPGVFRGLLRRLSGPPSK